MSRRKLRAGHHNHCRWMKPAGLVPECVYVYVCFLQEWDMVFLQSALVDALEDISDDLCGVLTTFKEMWYVQEKDLMALALDGHYTKHTSHLKCHRKAPATATV